jgi:CheY-like chemotaxis protein
MAGIIKPRTLVVDDSRDNADTLAEVIRLCGAEVRVAYNGADGLQIAGTFLPHLALLDLAMPKLDGYMLVRQFRETESLRATRLIAVSGFADPNHQRLAIEAGFDDFLIKPCSMEQIETILAEVRERIATTRILCNDSQRLRDCTQKSRAEFNRVVEQSRSAMARSAELRNRPFSRGATYFATLDSQGVILIVNKTWGETHDSPWFGSGFGIGTNYLGACQASVAGEPIAQAIRAVLFGGQAEAQIELDCDGRLFLFQAVANDDGLFIIFKDCGRSPS